MMMVTIILVVNGDNYDAGVVVLDDADYGGDDNNKPIMY